MIAPINATMIAPSSPPPVETPIVLKSQPPISAPMMPTMMSPITPKPPPFMMTPASQPATSPTMMNQTNSMAFSPPSLWKR